MNEVNDLGCFRRSAAERSEGRYIVTKEDVYEHLH